METEEKDLEMTFTEEEVQEIADWIESLTLVDLAALRKYWEDCHESKTFN